MTKEQAKKAYRLAYVTALRLISERADKRPLAPYKTDAIDAIGLSEDERDKIWKTACEDMWRRHENWRDAMIRQADDYAETYSMIYQ